MNLPIAPRILQVLAAIAATVLARRRRDHIPVAIFLGGITVADAIHSSLLIYVLYPARASLLARGLDPALTPFTGAIRMLGHLDQALFLLWPAGLAALAAAVFLRRPRLPLAFIALAWALGVLALALGYPAVRGDLLRRAYLGAEMAALAFALGSAGTWILRREAVTLPRFVGLAVAVVDCGTLVGPYLGDPFATWGRAQALYLVLYAGLVLVQGGSLWRSSPTSRSE